ncbi:MAG: RNA polymerase sigma-54 factor [Coprobacter sp.]|uniref:RNA polymerase factor sigma-54 n=1 Tax=Barnesiella propionica TaxID=2981781 RepID=UPI000D7ADF66|nr:RNA polymerase factor sigma-54 [Barnesiella propionica]MBO1735118.1 RNA polymerase factor sigma-54 [Barnesiella sp. GGCC_0306]MBS7038824.1 RNA polymerase factor sigma-54 [Bacteroidales bacterium]MCU6768939.1 RNA polymerase factor sigma-54 [Barnesiella propionica]PWM89559.1 MAG: RNA polymerase sigma-54 factor [Coprobacter sp.]
MSVFHQKSLSSFYKNRLMLKQQLQQKLQQKLSPQQIQIIRLLELTELELEERVKQELVENPALEEGGESLYPENESQDDGPQESAEELSLADYRSEDDIPDYRLEADNFSRKERREEIPFSGNSSFHDFLERQLGERSLTDQETKIAEYIIGNIDDNGYLQRPIAAISDDLIFQIGIDVSVEKLDELLQLIQDFEPAGVGASNLRECLMLQLERKEGNPATLLAYNILENSFEEFTKKHYDKIIRQYEITETELKNAIQEITQLNPKPGSAWNNSFSDEMSHIIPDFIVESQDGELTVNMSNSNMPELRISKDYQEMFDDYNGNKANQTKEKKDALLFVKQKLDAAQWFVNAIKQRNHTLMSTMQAIVEIQRDFFLTGDESTLKPMILRDVAERSGFDISTISRASNSKYVQTNFGVFPLKYFFSESLQNDSGEEISSREIKRILQDFVNNEDKRKPLSDEKLCDMLQDKGYVIARRTVAKYREQLSIPVARLRKEI